MEQISREIVGDFHLPSGNIAIVASRFNEFIVERLIAGAQDILVRHGVKAQQIDIYKVPGAFELPFTCQRIAQTGRYVGIVALGTVIRGETAHFEYVSSACAQGLLQAQLKTDVPITFGVITTENLDQAIARAGSTVGNKGSEAALALIEVINLLGKISND